MLTTEFTKLLNIQHPVVLAGMGPTSGSDLVAAVTNAGGLGVVGGVRDSPATLREKIKEIKAQLKDPSLPFGVDLLIPKIGGTARKTNKDYTKGNLEGLVDVCIEEKVKLFVVAVGVPPKHLVDKLHAAGILYMNMVGHPKHVHKACAVGADIICAQGGEAGGHTGEIPFSILIPACADACKNYISPLTGKKVLLIAGGGIADGRGLAASLMYGASAVWVGTRFIPAKESGAPKDAQEWVVKGDFDSTIRTTIFSGRPLRTLATPYVVRWEKERRYELEELTSKGIRPVEYELERLHKEGTLTDEIEDEATLRPMGMVSGLITKGNQTAAEIVQDMVDEAEQLLSSTKQYLRPTARL